MNQSTFRRWAALVLAGGSAFLLWSHDTIPEEFVPFTDTLRGCPNINVTLSWPDPHLPTNHAVSISLTGEDRAEIHVPTQGATVRWDGRAVRVLASDIEIPLMDMADRADALMAEICSGLSGSKWRPIDPPVIGVFRPAANTSWAKVTLPFDWVDFDVLMAIDPSTNSLKYLVFQQLAAPFVVTARMPRGQHAVRLSSQNWVGLGVTEWYTAH